MEIKVGIRVKVLVSPLPRRLYYSSGKPPCFLLLPGLHFLFASSASSASLRLPLWFDTAAGTLPHDNFSPPPFVIPLSSPSRAPFSPILSSQPGNSLRLFGLSLARSRRYFCHVLTDNRFSLSAESITGARGLRPRSCSAIYVPTRFLLIPVLHLRAAPTLSRSRESSKTPMVVRPDNGDYPRRRGGGRGEKRPPRM